VGHAAHIQFLDLALTKRRAGKAEINLVKSVTTARTSKPWQKRQWLL
jgi:hypothetical protein